MTTFERELTSLINRHCVENESNTPDFILAQYLTGCLAAFTTATQQRTTWLYGDAQSPAVVTAVPEPPTDTALVEWLQALLDRGEKTTDVTLWRDWDVSLGAPPLYAISQSHWSDHITGESLRVLLQNAMRGVEVPGWVAPPAVSPRDPAPVRNICDTCGEPYLSVAPTWKHDCARGAPREAPAPTEPPADCKRCGGTGKINGSEWLGTGYEQLRCDCMQAETISARRIAALESGLREALAESTAVVGRLSPCAGDGCDVEEDPGTGECVHARHGNALMAMSLDAERWRAVAPGLRTWYAGDSTHVEGWFPGYGHGLSISAFVDRFLLRRRAAVRLPASPPET